MRLPRPRLLSPREALRSYGTATAFLLLVTAGLVVTDTLPAGRLSALRQWASTDVVNLHHHPVPALIVSAFLPTESTPAWLLMIALAMFGANRGLGNLRLALVCAAGHIVGTVVSEGIVAYRVSAGALPATWTHIVDIGPSYVVASAVIAAVLLGSVPAKLAALADLAILVFLGHIFAALTRLHVAPTGHLTAMLTSAGLLAIPAIRRAPARALVAVPRVPAGSPNSEPPVPTPSSTRPREIG